MEVYDDIPFNSSRDRATLKTFEKLTLQGEFFFSFEEEYEIHSSNTERRNGKTSTLRQREALSKLSLFKKDSFHQSNFPIEQIPTLPIEL